MKNKRRYTKRRNTKRRKNTNKYNKTGGMGRIRRRISQRSRNKEEEEPNTPYIDLNSCNKAGRWTGCLFSPTRVKVKGCWKDDERMVVTDLDKCREVENFCCEKKNVSPLGRFLPWKYDSAHSIEGAPSSAAAVNRGDAVRALAVAQPRQPHLVNINDVLDQSPEGDHDIKKKLNEILRNKLGGKVVDNRLVERVIYFFSVTPWISGFIKISNYQNRLSNHHFILLIGERDVRVAIYAFCEENTSSLPQPRSGDRGMSHVFFAITGNLLGSSVSINYVVRPNSSGVKDIKDVIYRDYFTLNKAKNSGIWSNIISPGGDVDSGVWSNIISPGDGVDSGIDEADLGKKEFESDFIRSWKAGSITFMGPL